MMQNVTELNFPVCLAPMVGLTHVALRQVIQDYMPEDASTHWPTEMLSSRRLPSENLKTTPETIRRDNEEFLVPQILGNQEEPIRKSVLRLTDEWGASGIDINMGCPVQKALKHNYGVSLMGDVDYAARVVEMTKKSARVPVSVKLRAVGSEKSVPELIEFVQKLVNAGADWITLHPRTAEQKRRGFADWSQISELKKKLSVPIIGNGDVQTVDDVFAMLQQTSADKVMVGRALAARPWLVWQVGKRLNLKDPTLFKGLKVPETPIEEGAEYGKALLRLIDYCENEFMTVGVSENLVMRKLNFYIRTTHVWLEFGHALMAMASNCQNLNQLKETVQIFFDQEQRMSLRTELRQ